jgi:CHAT domain-containing protein/Flp pilus assembly protein TadD
MRILGVVLLFIAVSVGHAQKFGDLLKQAAKEAVNETASSEKLKMDSVDFQLAISINENAGFFDVKEKGEGFTQGLYALGKDATTKTQSEIMRDSLETALGYYNARMYKFAELEYLKVKRSLERNGMAGDLNYLRCLSNLGLVYLIKGQYDEAETYITAALKGSEEMLGKNSVAYATNLNNHAKLNQQLGKFNDAETQFDEAQATLINKLTKNSMQNAIITNNKAMLNMVMGRNDQAVELMKTAVAIAEKAAGTQSKKSFDARKFQSNQALIYQLAGKYPESEATFLAIKKVFETRKQTGNPEYAALLNQLGILYIQMNKLDQVEPLLKKAAEIYKKGRTENNASFAKVQNDLGVFYRMQDKFVEAEVALKTALDMRATALGTDHPDYVKTVENLGLTYWKKGDLAKAYPLLKEGLDKSLSFINSYFKPMSEAEKTKYWETLQPRFQRFYNFSLDYAATSPAVLTDVFNAQIATKALLLNSTNKVKKTILTSGDKVLIKNYLTWIGKKEALSHYYTMSKDELKEQKIDLKALEKETNDIEKLLSSQSHEFSEGYSAQTTLMSNLSALLKDDEALVEIIRVRTFNKDFTDQSRYVALVLTKNSANPTLVVLENGQHLETRYAKFYKNAAINKLADTYSYDQYWAKLDAALAGKKTIYFSPDGVYNQINVNTLKKPDGDYVLGRYDVVMMGNAKDIIRLKQPVKAITKKSAFLLGFPDYGGTAVALPGTKVELDGISKILKTSGFTADMKQEKEASEKNIKNIKAPSLMHIATHGYFLADSEVGNGSALGVDAENAKNNPLLRSGLILANPTGQKQDTTRIDFGSTDNGVLTAYEAMNLDLEGTDLIVLSACETGLGDVKAGEGVYGLQRAFLVAGANALVMSLWKVDDAATQQLMTNFYTNWTKTGNKFKAFKQAQQQLMIKYKEPYYWGAFVMMGM